MVRCQSRSRRCHDVFYPGLIELDDIGITFDQETIVLFGNGLFGLKNTVQDFALVVNIAFRRIEVFGRFFVVRQNSSSKTQNPARHALNRKHHATFETVKRPVVFWNRQTRAFQKLQFITFSQCFFCKSIPSFGRISQGEFFYGFARETSFLEIRKTDGFAFFRMQKRVVEIIFGKFRNQVHAFPNIGIGFFLIGLFGFLDFDIVFFGQKTNGFRIGKMGMLHQKSHRISTFSGAEIFPNPFGGRNHKRRRALVRERTQSFEVASGSFQLHKITNNLLNASSFENGINGGF